VPASILLPKGIENLAKKSVIGDFVAIKSNRANPIQLNNIHKQRNNCISYCSTKTVCTMALMEVNCNFFEVTEENKKIF